MAKYKLVARGMNKMFNTVSDEKSFLVKGFCLEAVEDIRKKAFPDWPEIVIVELEEA